MLRIGHDNGIVGDKAYSQRQGHQQQIVAAVATETERSKGVNEARWPREPEPGCRPLSGKALCSCPAVAVPLVPDSHQFATAMTRAAPANGSSLIENLTRTHL